MKILGVLLIIAGILIIRKILSLKAEKARE